MGEEKLSELRRGTFERLMTGRLAIVADLILGTGLDAVGWHLGSSLYMIHEASYLCFMARYRLRKYLGVATAYQIAPRPFLRGLESLHSFNFFIPSIWSAPFRKPIIGTGYCAPTFLHMFRSLDAFLDLFLVSKSGVGGEGLVEALLAVGISQGIFFRDVEEF